ncbi:MAG TPA: hypothetical protein VEX86_10660 [Longimicrobium sp.]|nr:hypothetical protein [Longimicrobium sp.]
MSTRQTRPTSRRATGEIRIEMVRLPHDVAERTAMLRSMISRHAATDPAMADFARAFAPSGGEAPRDEPCDPAGDGMPAGELERFREIERLLAGQAEVLEAIGRGRAVVAGVVGLGIGVAATLVARRSRRVAEVDSF